MSISLGYSKRRIFSFRHYLLTVLLMINTLAKADLPVEPIPNIATLPEHYGDSWVFVHDFHFTSLLGGKMMLIDVAATTRQYKGDFQAAMQAGFVESKKRGELYVAETVYARAAHGQRTDLITIYDKVNLRPIGEIILPGNKRALMAPLKGHLRLTKDEQFAFVYNFTPGASVTVVDMDKRQLVAEVPIPGCTLIYPTGPRGFSTLCGNGSLASYQLDRNGAVIHEQITEVFNDIDTDPLYMNSVEIEGVRYFPSFLGRLQPIAMDSAEVKVGTPWSLLNQDDIAAGWRPSGWQLISADKRGRLYLLMRENAVDGEHDFGGGEVWVFDVDSQRRIDRIVLKQDGDVMQITGGDKPYLVISNSDYELDIYDALSGQFIHTIGGWSAVVPAAIHAAR